MKKCKITVILTSYNHAKYIKEAIKSILNQTYKDFELIIWDDASTDESWEIIQSYDDTRIKAFRNEESKRGIYGINKVICEIAQGEYIAIHHSDDAWEPTKLEKQVEFLESHPNVGAVFTHVEMIDENNKYLENDWFNISFDNKYIILNQLFNEQNHLCHPSVLIRKKCYEKVGVYKYGLAQTGDAEMWSRVLLNYDIFIIEEKLTKHRRFSDNTNASAVVESVFVRSNNEWNTTRENFLNISNFDMVCKIFPQVSLYNNHEYINIKYLIAIVCLLDIDSLSAKAFGISILIKLVNEGEESEKIEKYYKFSYLTLIEYTKKYDVYRLKEKNEVYTYKHKISSLNNQITNQNEDIKIFEEKISSLNNQIINILNSYSWAITRPFRNIANKLRKIKNLLVQTGKYIFNKLPLSTKYKNWTKHYIFLFFGRLFSNSPSYRIWLENKHVYNNVVKTTYNLEQLFNKSAKKKILIIDASTPTPDKDAGSVTIWFFLKALIELEYDVVFIPYDMLYLEKYTNDVRDLGVYCLTSHEINSIEIFFKEHGNKLNYIFLYRVHTAMACYPFVKKYAINAKVIFDTVDLHYIREQRKAELEPTEENIKNAEYTKNAEYQMMQNADATIVLSTQEESVIKEENSNINIYVIPLIIEIHGNKTIYDDRKDIAFIGGFLHQPNIDAIKFFVNEIWPIFKTYNDDVKLLIIGSHMPDEIFRFAQNDYRIKPVGYVENLDTYFNSCRVTIAPLRYGAGIKGKIGTSSSYAVPCVATTIAAEGMGLINNVDIIIADQPQDFADKLSKIYNEKTLWEKISKNTLAFVEKRYSYEVGKNHLKNLLESLGG